MKYPRAMPATKSPAKIAYMIVELINGAEKC
jgi:hypothetical protein